MKIFSACLFLFLLNASSAISSAADSGLFSDEEAIDDVNEGELMFLPEPPPEAVHEHSNRITLTATTLQDGWARLYQCHTHLDAVDAAQIVYHEARVRKLQLESVEGIGNAHVEGATVQLKAVTDAARLCISAESRMVRPLQENSFVVRNGPFMRKFLDGYYPMHVQLEVRLPPGNWILDKSRPVVQPGFSVSQQPGLVKADAWFEGELVTEFYFSPATNR